MRWRSHNICFVCVLYTNTRSVHIASHRIVYMAERKKTIWFASRFSDSENEFATKVPMYIYDMV